MAIIDFITNPTNAAEIVAFTVSLFTVARKQAGYWWVFCLYLAVTISVEAVGFWIKVALKLSNHGLYNFFMLLQVLFFTQLFFRFHRSKRVHLFLLIAFVLFVLFFFGEGVQHSFKKYHLYSRQLLSVFVVLFSCNFYFSMLKLDGLRNPLLYAPFWIVTGLFFYYFGTIAMFCFYDVVSQIKLNGNISFYNLVIGCLSGIMYGTWIIGFICRKKHSTISMQSL